MEADGRVLAILLWSSRSERLKFMASSAAQPGIDLSPIGVNGLPFPAGYPVDGQAFLVLPADHRSNLAAEVFRNLLPGIQPLLAARGHVKAPEIRVKEPNVSSKISLCH